ncbi:BamA/TamA family outer membrane protein [Allomuricauda sp. d1]|uniref:translocation and assembly module lipoprotein TamL n=1 Tax=Allomuricauda sp. d1 TaxID=3136725 RepID=UPI0031D32CB0
MSLSVTFWGCNSLKKVEDGELLLIENTIYVDGEKVNDEPIENLIAQKPNTNLLGYPLRLNLYNLAKDDPDSLYRDWLHRKEKREKRLNNLLSKKQVNRLGQSFMVKGFSEFLKRVGEPPVIIDTTRTKKSIGLLEAYYGSKGYFNNSASYEITEIKERKGTIDYNVTLGKPYFVDSLTRKITSRELDSIYIENNDESFVKEGKQFDLSDFSNERSRLTSVFRNSGVYDFQESSITYDIVRDTALLAEDQNMDVRLNISRAQSDEDTVSTRKPYTVHKFKKINIYADYDVTADNTSLDSLQHENYTIFYDDKLQYKPDALTDAVFLEQDSIYRELDKIRTYRQIGNLNTFKYPNILIAEEVGQSDLIADVYLSPRPKYSLELDFDVTHSNIQRVGTSFGTSVITRNVFGGAETLSISARGAIGILSNAGPTDGDFTSELGGDINLTFPRIWFPINTEKVIPYYMLPQTRLSVGTNFQNNIGLDRQSLNTVLSYKWSPTDFLTNNIELINIEFVRNTDINDFFNVYNNTYDRLNEVASQDVFLNNVQLDTLYNENDNLTIPDGTNGFIDAILNDGIGQSSDDISIVRSIRERQTRLTENNLIFTSNYTYTKNNKQGINDLAFYQFRFKVESAGNLLSLATNVIDFEKNDNDQSLVFGVPFSQYLKTEFDYIKHWQTSRTDVLAFRSFVGLAVPYGNSNSIPFVRSYFAGGSNDNRAWNAYELGPGSTSNLNDFNEANLKVALNLEFRFPIFGDFKGALFADAGNIWNVFDSEDNPDAIFTGFDSLGDMALGSGFGLRYDFTYFVFRLDMGFKTYNPAEEPSKRWFRDYNFRNAVFNVGINYPF